jgi:hypothetical protein
MKTSGREGPLDLAGVVIEGAGILEDIVRRGVAGVP